MLDDVTLSPGEAMVAIPGSKWKMISTKSVTDPRFPFVVYMAALHSETPAERLGTAHYIISTGSVVEFSVTPDTTLTIKDVKEKTIELVLRWDP